MHHTNSQVRLRFSDVLTTFSTFVVPDIIICKGHQFSTLTLNMKRRNIVLFRVGPNTKGFVATRRFDVSFFLP